ncbi:polycomb protein SUZ12 [Harmonia axyridis]|uniref:polycomb protein SUZ12 n=1 Tax=Harmonia axyridis TaxID=115357 RepID=UPI001E27688E|nr:polycomb protein SUZ12 [Harmonia axyridis]
MPPKKRDKEAEAAKAPRIDHIQADHELFLQAFEKPTQIYRYLRTRNLCSPIFLNRTLTYMKYRMSRTHKNRKNFKVDDMLEKITKAKDNNVIQPGFINITFLSFNDQNLRSQGNIAEVEIILLKISHKKRKESSAPCMQVSLGTAEVPINPSNDSFPNTASTISISTEKFNSNGGPLAKSHILLFRLQIKKSPLNNDNEEPENKRMKIDSDNSIESQLYGAELTVYDKHNRCYLTDGDYDVVVTNFVSNSPKKHSNWENISDLIDTCNNLDAFMKDPILKFKLNWSSEALAKIVDRPKPYSHSENKENIPVTQLKKSEKIQIVYQFVYNNNSRQQTEACEDLHCPWCSLNCDQLYTLLKHLKLCHSRFTFTYVPISVGARIDVAINELYDGSYTGSPHDLIIQPSVCSFSRNGPVRRASVTHILVCHPKRPKSSLSEFIELDDCEYDGQRPFITGHNRLYHHTTTCLPIYPKEMDVDSEGENDPEWLRNKTMTMIDEFTDVNEGEKELMKMWNLHVMKYGFVGNCQIPLACQMFVQQKGKELLLRNLYKNFVVHMSNLFDFGLVSAVCMYTTIQKLQEMVAETMALSTVLKESREAQIDNWSKTGCVFSKEKCIVRTPNGRKTGTVGNPRRKGLSTPSSENYCKRSSESGEPTRKRLSLSLNKNEVKTNSS